jgi:hypothetical protein
MPCDAVNGRMCLADHIWGLADRPSWADRDTETRAADHLSLICFCPAAEHGGRKLQISVGKHKRIIWNCHAGCSELDVRHALITKQRIMPVCLPISADRMNDLIEHLLAISRDTDLGHADARLRVVELLTSGLGRLPRGGALDALAASCGVSRSEAYRARSKSPRPK